MGKLTWSPLGKVFGPDAGASWMRSHAQVPTPLLDEQGRWIRVYFASRPEPGLTMVGFVDLDAGDPTQVVRVHETPVLEPGLPGTFDEHGVMPSCAVKNGDQVYLYYSGWSRSVGVPYTNSTGIAISDDGGVTFRRVSRGPVLAKSLTDPYSATSPFVMRDDRSWHMWYCSGTDWVLVNGKYEHVYDIKRAISTDGIHWSPTGAVALGSTAAEEALTRPWISHLNGTWNFFYCHRKASNFRDGDGAYRISWIPSESFDKWPREIASGLDFPSQGWDQNTRAYPAVLTVGDQSYLFYNGDGFGVGGFGVANLEASV